MGKNHNVTYTGSNGKVEFTVRWSKDPNHRATTRLKSLYYGNPRKAGEIGGRAVVAGLQRFSRKIDLTNASSVRLDGGDLPRAYMPSNYNVYKGFEPAYDDLPELEARRTLVSAMRGNQKLSMEDVRKLAPFMQNHTELHRLIGSKASNANILRALQSTTTNAINPPHIARSWRRSSK